MAQDGGQDLAGKDVAFVSPDAFAGYWLPMDARLRADFDVPGDRPERVELTRRKSSMKQVFADAGFTQVSAPTKRRRVMRIDFE